MTPFSLGLNRYLQKKNGDVSSPADLPSGADENGAWVSLQYNAKAKDREALYQLVAGHLALGKQMLSESSEIKQRQGVGVILQAACAFRTVLKDNLLAVAIIDGWILPNLKLATAPIPQWLSKKNMLNQAEYIYKAAEDTKRMERLQKIILVELPDPNDVALAQNEESHQGKAEAVQGSSSSKEMVFDKKTLDDLAELEKKVNKKVSKKDLKRLSKEEREALAKATEEANLAWAKYRETYLEWQKEKNVERAKQGKELYQEFIIPRGTATYMSFDVKIEDLNAGVHDGGYRGPMRYRYFVPEIGEGEKAPLILFLHGTDWQRVEYPRNGTNNYYQFREPEILAFVQPEAQEKHPCFLVAPQQINGTPWCSPPRSSPSYALKNAVDVVDELIARYPQIDTNRLYVTGVDSGSAGAFEAVAQYPNKFAAVVAMSGGRDPHAFAGKQKTTAWTSYCEGESPGVIKYSDVMFDLFSSWGGDSRLVVYPSKGHMSWEYGYVDENLYKWLFQQSL